MLILKLMRCIMTLQPVTKYEQEALLISDMSLRQNKQPGDFFCKTLTASDTSTHGGFSVPHRAAEKIFPPLDFSMQPPAQELVARDLHHQSWKFRHIYRGQPKRHLLTTGWSVFVSSKRLSAGDAVLFVRDEKSQLLLGVRRANRQQPALSSSVISSDSMHIGVLAAAAHAAANNSPFTIYYNPWASPAEFVIPLAKYNKAMFGQVSLGMRFRMMFETEESGVRRYMGTITGISDLDPVRWKNSQWRSLQVGWDESTAGERPSRVSIWEIEPVMIPFYMCPSPFLRQKFHQQTYIDTEIENAYRRGMSNSMPWVEDMGMKDSIFPGLSLVQWMSMQQHGFQTSNMKPAANVSSNSLSFEDPSKLLSFQSPNNPNQRNHLVNNPLQQPSPSWPQHQQQQQNYVYNQLQQQQQQKPQSLQISGGTQPQHQISGLDNRTSMQPLSISQHQTEQQQQQQTQLQQAPSHLLQQQQQTLQILQKLQQQQNHMFSPLEPLQQQVMQQLKQQQSQYKAPRVHPHGDDDVPLCSTSPWTNNFLIKNQQGPSKFLQTQSRSDMRVKHELPNLKLQDQTKDKANATEPTTSYCLDAAGGNLPHKYNNVPNMCLEGDVSQSKSDVSFGANMDSLPPDALLSRGFDSQNMGGSRDIETELSAAAEISPESFGMSFKANDSIAKDTTSVVGKGLWGSMRTYTKVQKRGSVGRTVDVTSYKGYSELRNDLARMFGIEGEVEDGEWKLVYVDHENDILLVGDDPWEEFVSCVESIKILSYSQVQKMRLDGDFGTCA